MAKQPGLGDNFYIAGYDLSGDVGAINTIADRTAMLDMTAIDKSAHERIHALASGEISFNSFFNDATDQQFAALKGLLKTDRIVMYFRGTTLGDQSASMVAKQINFDWARAADMGLIATIQCLSNPATASAKGTGLQFTRSITAGKRTDTAATEGTGIDDGAQAAAVTISTSSIADPTVITTATDHGLTTGDKIVIVGHTSCTPDINGIQTVLEVLTDTTFTIDVNVTDDGVGGTSTLISTRYGLAAYLQVFAFIGTSVTVKFQESSDDAVTDAYADVTGAAFTAVSSAPDEEFIETSRTLVVERWLRLVTTGTFNPATFAVTYFRYKA